jgi:hypothetical protein
MANCRLQVAGDAVALFAHETPLLTVRNCEVVSLNWFYPLDWVCPPGGRLTVENTVITGGVGGIAFHHRRSDLWDVSIRLRNNTLAAEKPLKCYLDRLPQSGRVPGDRAAKPIRLEAFGNVFHARTWVFGFDQSRLLLDRDKELEPAAAEDLLGRLLDWRERHNVYPEKVDLLALSAREVPREATRGRTLNDWRKFWKTDDSTCVQGPILYQAGGVRLSGDARVRASDFRLRRGSTGYRAGEGGRDLGADVDLVGPGTAYERWKKTPGYQEWLAGTGEVPAGK